MLPHYLTSVRNTVHHDPPHSHQTGAGGFHSLVLFASRGKAPEQHVSVQTRGLDVSG